MPIVKVMKGDLLEQFKNGSFKAIAHGCNTRNLMGAGIADQIHQQFPQAYKADADFHERISGEKSHNLCLQMGGQLSVAHVDEGTIFNLYTQIECGRHGDYQLLQNAMQNLNKFCKQRSITRVGVPLIGAGIAGLDIIGAMTVMNACTPDVDLTVVVWGKDDASWGKAFGFYNFSFPRKFRGAVRIPDPKLNVALVRTLESPEWGGVTFNRDTIRVMQHNGERCLSFNHDNANTYILIENQNDFDGVKDRFHA